VAVPAVVRIDWSPVELLDRTLLTLRDGGVLMDPLQDALDRASGKQWPPERDARIAHAITDRRVLALEVLRLQRVAEELVDEVEAVVKADDSLDAESPYFWSGSGAAIDALRAALGLEVS
jgi:hypothetical protein